MVRKTFQDCATEKQALAFLLGRFSGPVLKGGEYLVPEAALEALAEQNTKAFEHLTFAVLDRKGETFAAFADVFRRG